MANRRKKLLEPPNNDTTIPVTLVLHRSFVDQLSRIRTFYCGHRFEAIVERLVLHAAEKDGFVAADHEPYLDVATSDGDRGTHKPEPRRRKSKKEEDAQKPVGSTRGDGQPALLSTPE